MVPDGSMTERSEAWSIAYLIAGDEGAARDALQEALVDAERGQALQETAIRATLRRAARLPSDRFFLRALAHSPLEGDPGSRLMDCLDRLPEPERAALVLQAVAALAAPQIASYLRLDPTVVADGLNRGWERLCAADDARQTRTVGAPATQEAVLVRLRETLLAQVPPPPPAAPTLTVATADAATGRPNGTRRLLPLALLTGAAALGLVLLLQRPQAQERVTPPPIDRTALRSDPGPGIQLPRTEPSQRGLPRFSPADLQRLDPQDIVDFTTIDATGGIDTAGAWIMTSNRAVIATKLIQWLGEVAVLPQRTEPISIASTPLVLRFGNGWAMRLVPERGCGQNPADCAVDVMVVGSNPVRVHQIDLALYLSSQAWLHELYEDRIPAVLLTSWEGSLHMTQQQADELFAREAAALHLKVKSVQPAPRVTQYQDADGRWRTSLAPVWESYLEPPDPAKSGGAYFVVDDTTGEILYQSPR